MPQMVHRIVHFALSQIQSLQSDSWLSGGLFQPMKSHFLLAPLCGVMRPTAIPDVQGGVRMG